MKNDSAESERQRSNSAAPTTRHNYNFLLRTSRKLGGVATKSSSMHDVWQFMKQPITYDLPARWWGNGIALLRGEGNHQPHQDGSLRLDSQGNGATLRKQKDLREIVAQSHEVLMAANTVFPLTLFPDTVVVDRTKVTITRRDFFWSSDVMSIRIEDVLNVSAGVGPFFGSLTIASRVMSTTDHFQINHFWRHDALRLKQIIQGYVIAQHNNLDTAHLTKQELIDTLIELGLDSNK